MAYTGQVEPGGPADVRELPGLTITKLSVGPMDNNAYLLECTESADLLLIDAANEPDRLLAMLEGRPLAGVVTTHRHGDHWQGLADVITSTGARTYTGRNDVELATRTCSPATRCSLAGLAGRQPPGTSPA
jgi:glyoxylase-like metal-dependent hydrolase (beta-lactamase superfamily II)